MNRNGIMEDQAGNNTPNLAKKVETNKKKFHVFKTISRIFYL